MHYPGLVLSVQMSNYLAGSGTSSYRPLDERHGIGPWITGRVGRTAVKSAGGLRTSLLREMAKNSELNATVRTSRRLLS